MYNIYLPTCPLADSLAAYRIGASQPRWIVQRITNVTHTETFTAHLLLYIHIYVFDYVDRVPTGCTLGRYIRTYVYAGGATAVWHIVDG